MGVTNQQIADLLEQVIKSVAEYGERQGQRAEAERAAFRATIDKLVEHDTQNHDEFRGAIARLTTAIELLQQEQSRHCRNWSMLWKLLAVPTFGGVIAALLALILR